MKDCKLETLNDPKRFEDLAFEILSRIHYDKRVRKVKGDGGDDGIDIYIGELNNDLIIYQVKYYPGNLTYDRKKRY